MQERLSLMTISTNYDKIPNEKKLKEMEMNRKGMKREEEIIKQNQDIYLL